MNYMFYSCSSLTSINLSNFNCDKIKETNDMENMFNMFSNCSSLTSLNLSNFTTNNVKDMRYMLNNINKSCNLICNDPKILKIK